MRCPTVKTLARVFENPREARRIFKMMRAELIQTPAGEARLKECYTPPKTWDLRLTVLSASDPGLHGAEGIQSRRGERAEYLNTGDSYSETVIYWRGRYRVQSVGDFVETLERGGVSFP